MNILAELEPKKVFEIFEEISAIPRGSSNEERISNYIAKTAQTLGLEVYQDKLWNVIVKKQGTKGYETSEPVILQGHMDMVCEKNADVDFDFQKDSIKLKIEEGFIKADGTTLGADNGIAVAMMLAVLKEDISHPPLELVFTSDEEAGMNGAKGLDYTLLKGRRLINLDSEEEGHILAGCAGGLRSKIVLPITFSKSRMDFHAFKIIIKGLKGGHSGADIHLQRANANKLMGRLLNLLLKERLVWIREINGGNADNAIPRECETVVCFEDKFREKIQELCVNFEKMCQNEYKTAEEGIKVDIITLDETPALVFSHITGIKAVSLLMLIPNGVRTMSPYIDGLVESSNNLGIVRTNREEIVFTSAARSSLSSRKDLICEEKKIIADLCGADFEISGSYPAWEFNINSPLREVLEKTYYDMFQKEAKVDAIHAGLECGLFGEKLLGCDMVSIGPEMFDVHTPDERLSIASTKRTWDYLKEVLKRLK